MKKSTFLFVMFAGLSVGQAATLIDLTVAGSSSTNTANIGGSFFVQQVPDQSTGTGVINSFLRINSNDPSEQGFNTGTNNVLDNVGGVFTRPLLLSEVPIVTLAGTQYRQFLLDVNQTGASPKLSLNQIQLFQRNGDTGLFSVSAAGVNDPPVIAITGATEVFRMNNGGAPNQAFLEIQLDFSLNAGSGSGDMFLYVRNILFNVNLTNVFLYSQFGSQPGVYAETDGFEEWSVLKGGCTVNCVPDPAVPEPASVVLLGTLAAGIILPLRRRFAARQA